MCSTKYNKNETYCCSVLFIFGLLFNIVLFDYDFTCEKNSAFIFIEVTCIIESDRLPVQRPTVSACHLFLLLFIIAVSYNKI